MKKIVSNLILLFYSSIIISQSVYKGKVVDQQNQAISFANVIVYKRVNNSLIKGTISDENGNFELKLNPNEFFYMEVSFLGFKTKKLELTKKNLGLVLLEEKSNKLDEVVIKTKKQSLIRKNDRLIFNIDKTVVQELGSAIDVLKVTPNLVMRDDKLTMLGKSFVRIMVNGKMMPLKGDDLNSYLSSINSSNIKSIEVITVPPSEFEAEGNGGVINIILKREKKDFWSIVTRLSGTQRTQFSNRKGIALNYKKKNTYLTLSLTDGKFVKNNVFNNSNFYVDEAWLGNGPSRYQNDYLNYRFSIAQNINEKWELGASYSGSNSDTETDVDNIDHIYDVSNVLKYSLDSKGISKSDSKVNAFNLYSTIDLDSLGKNISVDFDYYKSLSVKNGMNSGDRKENNQTQSIFSNNTNIDYNFENFSNKIDFSLPFEKIKLKLGSKISISKTMNDFKFYNTFNNQPVLDVNQSNIFDYNEKIFALYISASKKITDKISGKIGLRAEKTITKSYSKFNNQSNENKYTKLFPTLFITYNLEDKKSISFNWSKRLNRPGFESLDPFKIVINPFKTVQGNPFLKPSYITNLELVFNSKKNEFKVYLQKLEDRYNQISEINPITKIVNYTYYNHIDVDNYGVTNTYTFDKYDWLTSYNTIDVGYSKIKSSIPQTIGNQQGFNAFIQTQNNIKLNSKNTFSLGVNYYYVFPSKQNLSESEGYGPLDLSLRLRLLKGDLNLSMSANDILKSSRAKVTSYYNNVKTTYKNYYDSRSISFSVRYTFGNKKIRTKYNRSGNKDIQNRARN
jgi:hypothetical protein